MKNDPNQPPQRKTKSANKRGDYSPERPIQRPFMYAAYHPVSGTQYAIPIAGELPHPHLSEADTVQTDVAFYNLTLEHQRFPAIPNFGVLCLNVPDATSLIVDDMFRSERLKLDMSKETDREKIRVVADKEKRRLLKQIKTLILQSMENGDLPFELAPRSLRDFHDHAAEHFLPEKTFVHYNDLIAWLRTKGYVVSSPLWKAGPALDEYEEEELELAREIARDLETRRSLMGRRTPRGWEGLLPPVSVEDDRLRVQERLSEALIEIQQLRAALKQTDSLPTEQTVNPRSEKSYLKLIGTLLRQSKSTSLDNPSLTKVLLAKMEAAELRLDPDTIRSITNRLKAELPDLK